MIFFPYQQKQFKRSFEMFVLLLHWDCCRVTEISSAVTKSDQALQPSFRHLTVTRHVYRY